MFDYDGESFIRDRGWEPTYDLELDMPDNVYAHIRAGNIDEIDLQSEISEWDYCRNGDVRVGDGYVTIHDLKIDDYNELDDNLYRWLEEYGDDLDSEYGNPEDEDDDYEEEE